ncbi:MAG: GntR family transcriptional regulator [Deltaproteobacteria bacterium]|nr:GntR family transcriptional regulator [Deltaproteobacteria bacterium]
MKNLGAEYENLDQKAYLIIKEMITNRKLLPGEKIPQENLAHELGISRTPLVSALKYMEKEKLVEAKPRKGFFVRLFTVQEMVNIFELREVLEGLAARRAAICITDKQVNKLNGFFKQYSSPIDQPQYKSYAREDRQFHSYVTEIGSKEFLKSILQSYNIISFSYQVISTEGLVRPPDETIHEHRAMIDAICSRSSDDAERLMRQHFKQTIGFLKNEIGKRSAAVNQ